MKQRKAIFVHSARNLHRDVMEQAVITIQEPDCFNFVSSQLSNHKVRTFAGH